jgi:hypothetical protein
MEITRDTAYSILSLLQETAARNGVMQQELADAHNTAWMETGSYNDAVVAMVKTVTNW